MVNRQKVNRDTIAARFLQTLGFWLMMAWPAVVLPTSWMVAMHETLGLGEWPQGPLTEYLARSVSLLYGYFGFLAIYCSFHVDRYRSLLRVACLSGLPASPILTVIGLKTGMPLAWAIVEGACVLIFCLGLWRLLDPEKRDPSQV